MTFSLSSIYLYILFSIASVFSANAQAPQAINYQGIARNGAGQPLLNQPIGLRLSILDGSSSGAAVYVESHQAITSNSGLFNVSIGAGTLLSGSFTSIDWGQSSKWLKTEMDANGGINYQLIGTTQFLSVPYSVYSDKSGNGMPNGVNTGDILYWNGSTWVPVPLPGGNRTQRSSITSNSASAQVSGNENGLGLALCNGVPTWGGCPLTISANPVSQISYTSAVSGGNITTTDNIYILFSGVCYGTNPNPTVSGNKTTDGNGSNFTSTITGLLPNTTYYVRAYGTQGFGTTYGDEISFTTLPLTVPTVSTGAAGSISNTTAQCGGAISSDGGAPITARGVCWSTSQNPTLANNFTSDSTGMATFVSNITGLNANTTYYVRAYASNSIGTAYGNEISFISTSVGVPILTTSVVTGITDSTAVSGGNISSDGGSDILIKGIVWDTQPNPGFNRNITIANSSSDSTFICNLSGVSLGKTYYIRSFAVNSVGTSFGNEVSFAMPPITIPSLTTLPVSRIASNTAESGGNIYNDGGSPVIFRGVCWDSLPNPTIIKSKTLDGSGKGNFASSLSGLIMNKTYYLRAFAINGVGTAYGNEVSFTTNPFPTVTIGTQIWSTMNLDVVTYRNGDTIPHRYGQSWLSLLGSSIGAWCWYNDDSATYAATYGRLYNWAAVNDPRGLAPQGWHIPTDAEWTVLTNYLGGEIVAGKALKETGTSHWNNPNSGATNSSNFTGLPGGLLDLAGASYICEAGDCGYWWSSSESILNPYWLAVCRGLKSGNDQVYREELDKNSGMSVRCVKNLE